MQVVARVGGRGSSAGLVLVGVELPEVIEHEIVQDQLLRWREPDVREVLCVCALALRATLLVPHRASSALRRAHRDWSPLNIVAEPTADAASVTVWMNRIDKALRRELTRPVFQTWNPTLEPAKGSVICDYTFERPVVTTASHAALDLLQRAQGRGRVWFVGAYSRYTMPLLENGVKSAMETGARALAPAR